MKTNFNKVAWAWILLSLAGLLLGGGRCAADTLNAPSALSTEAAADNGVRSITLPHFEPEMPAAPGRAAFLAACVSCHSPRYVTVQPPFPQRQWQETVGKMIKVYGADADTNQVREIVDYLVAVNGVAPKGPAAGSLPESMASNPDAGTNLQSHVETAPPLAVATADVRRGAAVFMQDCAGCHAVAGRGDGIVSPVLLPKPADLTVVRFSVELLRQVLWNGVPGTSMPSWRNLPLSDLNGLATYVQTLHPSVSPNNAAPEVSGRGRTLFSQACAPCHGVLGDGKSATAATLAPAPTNLKLEQPDSDYVLRVLRDGIPGTAMPVWKDQISESDRVALAGFVRSLYEPNKPSEK